MLTVRQSSTAQSRVQGGEPWRIFWAGAPPFSLEEKMGGAYTLPQPRLMFGRETLISDDGQTWHFDDACLFYVVNLKGALFIPSQSCSCVASQLPRRGSLSFRLRAGDRRDWMENLSPLRHLR